MTTTEALEQLQQLLKPLELPEWRKFHITYANVRWLARNMGIRNNNHPNFNEAQALVVRIIRENLVK